MKILYHHRTLGDGAEGIHISSMVNAFRQLGHEVRVAALIGEETNVKTRSVSRFQKVVDITPRAVYELMEGAYSVVGYRALMKHVQSWRPDFIYERYALFNLAGVTAARRARLPLVLEVNAPLAWERAKYERLTLPRIAQRCERWVCKHADLVEVVSTPLKDHLVDAGVPAERIFVLPNGADPTLFKPNPATRVQIRADLGISDDTVVIGFSGILRPWHGVELLLEAVAQIAQGRRLHVLIVGDGPSRADFDQLVRQLNLSSCATITGRVPHTEIPHYVTAFDVAVSPRATFYASPMKVPEYMAVGVPVVAPNTPNLQDLVAHGQEGLLFAPEDRHDLAQTLAHLSDNPTLRKCLGESARTKITGARTWVHNAALVLDRLREQRAGA
jgi:glycosyltransferase involved in cell wall biosynthesis